MIKCALENVLNDHLKCNYNSVEDIQNGPSTKLERGRENLDKDRAEILTLLA